MTRKLLKGFGLLAVAMTLPACFAQCEPNGPDTTFGVDSNTTGYQPKWQGDRTSWIRVTRVVGPGTSVEDDGNGALLNAKAMQGSGVLDPDAYIKLTGFLQLTPAFWNYTSINGQPSAAQAQIAFTLNGWPIGIYPLTASQSGPTLTTSYLNTCLKIHSQYLRFAGRLQGGRTCNLPGTVTPLQLRPGETTCRALNEIEASIQIRIGPPGQGLLSSVSIQFRA